MTIFFVIILLPLAVLDFFLAKNAFDEDRRVLGWVCVIVALFVIFAWVMNLLVLLGVYA